MHRPQLILADEPTGNLDPATAERVMDLLSAQVRAEGAACVLVTHSRTAAARADRVLTLTASGMHEAAGRAPGRSQAGPHPRGGSADVLGGRGAPPT